MILSGEKTEEYREIKPSFCARFLLVRGEHRNQSWWKIWLNHFGVNDIKICITSGAMTWKHYDTNIFVNGMTPPIPEFEMIHIEIVIETGNEDWGAKKEVFYFVIKLGTLISKVNCNG